MTATTEGKQSNIPVPDPSVIANERLAEAVKQLRAEMSYNRNECKGWIDTLQKLVEEKITGGFTNVKTRLDGNDTALVAALKAQKEEAASQTGTFKEVLSESKKGTSEQLRAINEKIDDLKERLSETGGRSRGIGQMITGIIAGLAALAAVLSALYVMTRADPSQRQQPQSSYQRGT